MATSEGQHATADSNLVRDDLDGCLVAEVDTNKDKQEKSHLNSVPCTLDDPSSTESQSSDGGKTKDKDNLNSGDEQNDRKLI